MNYKLIDSHMHIGGSSVDFDMPEESLIDCIKLNKIDLAIVSNADSAEFDHQQNIIKKELQVSQIDSLKRILTLASQYSSIKVAAWVKPHLEDLTPEFERLIAANLSKIVAIKLHPYHSKIKPTDDKVIPYIELARKYHLAVVSHTDNEEYGAPRHIYELACSYTDVNFVMVHLGLGSDNKEAIDLLGKCSNLYGDTTWVSMKSTLEVIKRYGSKKLLFGTDAPIDGVNTYQVNKKGESSLYQDYLHELPYLISKNEYEDLMVNNAMRVFNLQ